MSNPLFSVVVLTYNQEHYISRTLDSILEQEHKYQYEILIGEDCSKDNTRNIILEYKKSYPDIIKLLLNEHNMGMIKNFFNVLQHCKGKYIFFCAGDDYWLNGKVSTQIDFMEKNPDIGMCCANAVYLHENGKKILTKIKNGLHNYEDLIQNNDIVQVTACIKNQFIPEYIKCIDPVNKNWLTEDYPIWLYFAVNNINIYRLPDVLAVHRYIINSISHPKDYNKIKNWFLMIFDIRKYFLDLCQLPFIREKLEYELNCDLVSLAAKNNNYEDYCAYNSKIDNKNTKNKINKYIAKHRFLFNIVYQYYNIRKRLLSK
ncbi:MAG: glycosyltransferase [Treponema sp.]|nr:glycosyltransferase [Treponema sp.]